MSQKGIAHIISLLVIAAIAVGTILFFTLKKATPSTEPQSATVSLQTQYENPFDTSSQYVNPFSTQKNPFDLVK